MRRWGLTQLMIHTRNITFKYATGHQLAYTLSSALRTSRADDGVGDGDVSTSRAAPPGQSAHQEWHHTSELALREVRRAGSLFGRPYRSGEPSQEPRQQRLNMDRRWTPSIDRS